jgi:hypothetical protein
VFKDANGGLEGRGGREDGNNNGSTFVFIQH